MHLPRQATISLDYDIEPGKRLLLMVITEDQFEAVSAGEKASGDPLMKTLVSGTGTQSVVLGGGEYVVFLGAQDGNVSTAVTLRARASY